MSEQPQNKTAPPETMNWVPNALQAREIDEDCKRVEQIVGAPPAPPSETATPSETTEWARKRFREMDYRIPRTRFPRVLIKTPEEREAAMKATGERAARMIAERERKREETIDWAIGRVKAMIAECRKSPPI
jgi:hypothetical protein